jgi:hypothetical protein
MDCIWASEIGEVGSKPYVAHTKTANYLESITGEALCEEFVFFIAETARISCQNRTFVL